MAVKKKYLKWTSIATILVGSVALSALATVACSNTNTDNKYEIYNQWASNFSESKDAFDISTLDWYKNNTASIYVHNSLASSGTKGTIWNYPMINGVTEGGHFFATSITTIAEALVPTPGTNKFTINPEYIFRISIDSQLYDIAKNVTVHYMATQSKPLGITGEWNGDFYSDFVILRTTTKIFSSDNKITNFMSNYGQYRWLMANLTDINYYICSFSTFSGSGWPNSAEWISVKYTWNNLGYSSFKPSASTAAAYYSNYLGSSNTNGLVIGSTTDNRLAKNYAQQILLPELNIHNGSSGSLVGVNYNGSLLFIGTYWGGYGFVNSNGGAEFLGAIDLFNTNSPYAYGTYGLAPEYNNLKTI